MPPTQSKKAYYVTNPQTGRPIRVDGATYEKEVRRHPTLKRAKRTLRDRPRARHPDISLSEKQVSKAIARGAAKYEPLHVTLRREDLEPAERRRLKRYIAEGKSGRRPARGWSARKPRLKGSREILKERCGPSCFLRPDSDPPGFPICRRPSKTGAVDCGVDCGGLLAAKRRAAQYHYANVERAAEQIAYGVGCRWATGVPRIKREVRIKREK